jgi:hypothetical protein
MKENAAYKVKAEFVEVLAEFLETAPLRSRLGNGALILNGLPSRARQQADLLRILQVPLQTRGAAGLKPRAG